MSKGLAIFTVLSLCICPIYAQTDNGEFINLLEDAIPTESSDFNSSSAFFERWQLHTIDGNIYPNETQQYGGYSRCSWFTPVYTFNGAQCVNFDINGNGSAPERYVINDSRFTDGMPVAVMMYRREADSNVGINYNYPINVESSGVFHLHCIAGEIGNPVYNNNSDFIPEWGYLVAVAEKEIGNKTISIVDGEDGGKRIAIFDADNIELPSAYTYLKSSSNDNKPTIEADLSLLPDYKFLSFYAPRNIVVIGDLKLTGYCSSELLEVKYENHIKAHPKYFNLQGIEVSNPQKGNLYLLKDNESSIKIIY